MPANTMNRQAPLPCLLGRSKRVFNTCSYGLKEAPPSLSDGLRLLVIAACLVALVLLLAPLPGASG